jgi:N utilization substance protein B
MNTLNESKNKFMTIITPDTSRFLEYKNANTLSLSHRRGLVLHLLYALESNDYEYTVSDLIYSYNIDFGIIIDADDPIISFIEDLIKMNNHLDSELKKYLENWQLERISILVKLILRYGLFELIEKKSDSKLIIYEAVELAKGYAEEGSYRIVNGVLDAYSKVNRQ